MSMRLLLLQLAAWLAAAAADDPLDGTWIGTETDVDTPPGQPSSGTHSVTLTLKGQFGGGAFWRRGVGLRLRGGMAGSGGGAASCLYAHRLAAGFGSVYFSTRKRARVAG